MKLLKLLFCLNLSVFTFFADHCLGQNVLTSESGKETDIPQKTVSQKDPAIDSLVIGTENSNERKFDDLLSTPLGLPHKYSFSNQNPPEGDISSFVVGTKNSPEKAVKQTDKVDLGIPYKSETYISESNAADDYDSRSLGMPYTVKTKIQKEAERSGY